MLTSYYVLSVGPELRVELKAEKKALLVGETITVDCVAKGSEMLEDHWKYPGKLVSYTSQKQFPFCSVDHTDLFWRRHMPSYMHTHSFFYLYI